ncbi:GNAT family N-acetyltransferase [Streptomyces sp. BI20]|uniref:GNAT family N-acetyltransferase n=1 Tax=Streptomyces sp. BI20 TaxID=3403460 RepID=UPI003C7890D3
MSGTPAWVRLELDVAAFDPAPFVGALAACAEAGVLVTTLAELGDTPEHRRDLYELNRECSADIPGRGPFHTWEEYRRLRLEVPCFDAAGVVLAVDGDRWCGMSASSDHRAAGFAFNEMTGVRAGYRGRGLSLAMKVRGVAYARALGVGVVRTVHHPGNAVAIAMNRRLGYRDAGPWD